ncbi:DivIVA domain-containing protein [Dermacoccus barathri]|uniref:DivIVA domain-containing protein n=1 Tax=Dermacoccus barathri TaxID=322601 RepID=UPI00187A627B|nr:DivIVA domain-containing protein [Dermacoccus barathri]MBE7370540.1 DivIVA domain-containing protein [Dermacoccus barathri]
MAWSNRQIEVVERARFAPVAVGGYHPEDVERLRLRVLTAMRKAKPLPDLDAMALRRAPRGGVSPTQVAGFLTLMSVWSATTVVEHPDEVARRERDAEIAALTTRDDDTTLRWTHEQMDHVREKKFTLVGRASTSYDEHDVDDYLDSVVIAMRRGIELPDPQYARFDSAGLRRGYDPKEVDDFLDEIAHMQPEG